MENLIPARSGNNSARLLALGVLGAMALIVPQQADAAVLMKTATLAVCSAGAYIDCKSTAHLETVRLAGNDAGFTAAFNDWNGKQAANAKWTLVNGGGFAAGSGIDVTWSALAQDAVGGMTLQAVWTNGGTDAKTDYVWSQGVHANYKPGTGPGAVFFDLMDTASLSGLMGCNNTTVGASPGAPGSVTTNTYCDPVYPYQYDNRDLWDRPTGSWPNSSFDAYAFVSKVNYTTRTLTIFEGIQWGFVLSATAAPAVPEPLTWVMMVAGFGAIGAAMRRRTMVTCAV